MNVKELRRIIRNHKGIIRFGTATIGSMFWINASKAAVLETLKEYEDTDLAMLTVDVRGINNDIMYLDGKLSDED
jgi:hypothetical protein